MHPFLALQSGIAVIQAIPLLLTKILLHPYMTNYQMHACR